MTSSSHEMIAICDIRADEKTQSRASLDQDTIAEYAELYRSGATLPPVKIFFDGEVSWLADGFHRFHAAKLAGLAEIPHERTPGTIREAILFSVSANAKHGLRRTNADKRKAVETLLADPEWTKLSDREIARQCAVTAPFVGDVRRAICKRITGNRTVTRNGTTYEQDVSLIGTKPAIIDATPKPSPIDDMAAQLAEMRERYDEMARNLREAVEDNESMGTVFEADDRVSAMTKECEKLRCMNRVLNERINGLMGENAQLKKLLKSAQRRLEKYEQAGATA